MHCEGKWLPPLADRACDWLVRSLGFLQVLLLGYRLFHSILTSAVSSQSCCVVSLTLLSVNSGKSLELHLPLFPSQENQQAGRKRGWEKRKGSRENKREGKEHTDRQTDRQTYNTERQRREKHRPYSSVYLHFLLLNHELAVLLCAPTLTRR